MERNNDESSNIDWKQDDEGSSNVDLEKAKEKREKEREGAIENPDPEEEHQLYEPVAIQHNWYYEYKPECDDFEFSHEERIEDGSAQGVYRCTCCTFEMSDSEALDHIKKAKQIG